MMNARALNTTPILVVITMPTILLVRGWRVFFYANEGHEPIHVHARKGDADCKFWILAERFEIEEPYSFRVTP